MPAGYTTVSGNKVSDATGALIANATIYFQPCNAQGVPVSFSPGFGGQATDLPVSATITAGVFSVQLADTTLTSPVNIAYAVTVVDNLSQKQMLGPGYLIQPSGGNWSLDTFEPSLGALAVIQVGPTGAKGDPGDVSLAQLGAVAQRAALLALPMGTNLFDPGKATTGYALAADGTLRAIAGWVTTDYLFCSGVGDMVANVPVGSTGFSEYNSICFYDAALSLVGAIASTVAAGTAIPVPAGATFMRTYVPVAAMAGQSPAVDITSMGIYSGTVVPLPFLPFGFASKVDVASAVATAFNAALGQAAGVRPAVINLFSVARSTLGYIATDGTLNTTRTDFTATDFISVFGLSQIVSNAALFYYPGNGGTCFYDAEYRFLSIVNEIVQPGTPLAVPAGAYFLRAYVQNATTTLPAMMIVAGSTLPSAYVAFGYVTADQLATSGYQTPGKAGKRLGVFGDSYSGRPQFADLWQSIVLSRNAMTQTFQDAIGGRRFSGIFSHYGSGAGTGACDTGPISNGNETTFGCTAGQTLAQVLADVDVLIIQMGTNDNLTTIGAPGDAVTANTLYGNVAQAITSTIQANPSVRLLMVGPCYNSLGPTASIAAVDACIANVAASFGVPYLSMFKVSGVNALNLATLMVSDGIHPTQANFANIWGPTVASFVANN